MGNILLLKDDMSYKFKFPKSDKTHFYAVRLENAILKLRIKTVINAVGGVIVFPYFLYEFGFDSPFKVVMAFFHSIPLMVAFVGYLNLKEREKDNPFLMIKEIDRINSEESISLLSHIKEMEMDFKLNILESLILLNKTDLAKLVAKEIEHLNFKYYTFESSRIVFADGNIVTKIAHNLYDEMFNSILREREPIVTMEHLEFAFKLGGKVDNEFLKYLRDCEKSKNSKVHKFVDSIVSTKPEEKLRDQKINKKQREVLLRLEEAYGKVTDKVYEVNEPQVPDNIKALVS